MEVSAAPSASSSQPLALAAGGFALLLSVVFVRGIAGQGFIERYALLLPLVAVGLPVAVGLLRSPARRSALLGLAFSGWALLCVALSPNPTLAWWGGWLRGTGGLFVLALVSAWALGAAAGARGRDAVEVGLLGGLIASAGLALLQSIGVGEGLGLPEVDRATAAGATPCTSVRSSSGALRCSRRASNSDRRAGHQPWDLWRARYH